MPAFSRRLISSHSGLLAGEWDDLQSNAFGQHVGYNSLIEHRQLNAPSLKPRCL
jgi:hypothetical protein